MNGINKNNINDFCDQVDYETMKQELLNDREQEKDLWVSENYSYWGSE